MNSEGTTIVRTSVIATSVFYRVRHFAPLKPAIILLRIIVAESHHIFEFDRLEQCEMEPPTDSRQPLHHKLLKATLFLYNLFKSIICN